MKFRFSHIVPNRIHHIALLFLILIGFPLAGCGTFLSWTVPTAGVAALQERSIGDSVDDLTIRAELNQIFFEDNVELLQSVSFTVLEGRVLLKGAVEKPEDRIHSIKLAIHVYLSHAMSLRLLILYLKYRQNKLLYCKIFLDF